LILWFLTFLGQYFDFFFDTSFFDTIFDALLLKIIFFWNYLHFNSKVSKSMSIKD
jgi:hypothetical protein